MISKATFLPRIVMQYDRESPWQEWIQGSVLLADVSGFTPMTEILSELGAEGAELLNEILNRYFSQMISILQSCGGDVLKFGGDALYCFFQGNNTLDATLYAAVSMQGAMSSFRRIKTPVKTFSLKMKIGVACGDVLIGGLGDPRARCDFIFAGRPVELAARAESKAKADQIILASDTSLGQRPCCSPFPGEDKMYLVHAAAPVQVEATPRCASVAEVRPYLIREVHQLLDGGHEGSIASLVSAVSLFLQFSGFTYSREHFDLGKLNTFFISLIRLVHQFEGRLNHIEMGDKGSVCFFMFGTPHPVEKKEKLACSFSLELIRHIRDHFPGIHIKIGLTSGRVFSGIVGGCGRTDFTVIGDSVNVAARLMQQSRWSEVLMSEQVKQTVSTDFNIILLGKKRFKGKSEPQSVFQLQSRIETSQRKSLTLPAVGRTEEINQIVQVCDEAYRRNPSLLVIEGDPGVGKSYLVDHFLSLHKVRSWKFHRVRLDISLRSNLYSPWRDSFRSLIFKKQDPTLEEIKDVLITTDTDYQRYLSWHAEFYGTPCIGGETEYNEDTRKKLFHHQLSRIFLEHAAREPLILFIDDLHWADSLSLELLLNLLNYFDKEQLLLLATTRPKWKKQEFIDRSNCQVMHLRELPAESLSKLAQSILGGSIRDDFIELLYFHAHGNPFYTVHLLKYLMSNGLLEQKLGKWTVKKGAIIRETLSSDDITIAQMNDLTTHEKIHLRFASCLGPIFSEVVLKKAMGPRFSSNAWCTLLEQGFFHLLNSGTYGFPHALIQDAIYHSIPLKVRKKHHFSIARAIENEYSDNLDSWSSNLAYHYYQARSRKQAIDYNIIAGEKLFEKLSFTDSLIFYQNAYSLLKHSSDPRKWGVGLALARNLLQTGKFVDGSAIIRHIRSSAKRKNLFLLYLHANILYFECMAQMNNYNYLGFAKRLLKRNARLPPSLLNQLHFVIGKAYFRKGQFGFARRHLNNVTHSARHERDFDSFLVSHKFLASISKKQGNFAEALDIIESGIEHAQKEKRPYQELQLHIEKGNILIEKGEHHQVKELFLDLLGQSEKIGDIYLMSTILLNLGQLAYERGYIEEAEIYYHEANLFFRRTGSKSGYALSFNHLGALAFCKNQFDRAYRYYYQALKEFEKIGELEAVAEVHHNLAEVCLNMNKLDETTDWLDKFHRFVIRSQNPLHMQAYKNLRSRLSLSEKPGSGQGHL